MRLGSLPILAIRRLDQRGGLTSRRGENAYASAAPRMVGALHRRVIQDASSVIGDRPACVVDLGSGPGALTYALGQQLPRAAVVGVEPNPRMLDLARASSPRGNVSFLLGRAERIPVPDGCVDLVVSSLSAHHWMDLASSVMEIIRVLRDDGTGRIYDVRFATWTGEELTDVASRLGLPPDSLKRSVLPSAGRIAPYALIEITRPGEFSAHTQPALRLELEPRGT